MRMRKLRISKKAVIAFSFVAFGLVAVTTYFVASGKFSFDYRRRAAEWTGGLETVLENGENPYGSLFVHEADVGNGITHVKFMLYKDGATPPPVGDCVPDCEGKECGDDGCGGSCGVCNEDGGECCINGTCKTCLDEGDSYNDSLGPNDPSCGLQCCGDLVGLAPMAAYDENCEFNNEFVGYAMTCSDCGNGTCEDWENRCSCPEDCDVAEICDNGVDDDGDELVDCMDDECPCPRGTSCCTGGPSTACCDNELEVCIASGCCPKDLACGDFCCPSGFTCNSNLECVYLCKSDDDCPSGYYCDESKGECEKPLPELPSLKDSEGEGLVSKAFAQVINAPDVDPIVSELSAGYGARAVFRLYEIYMNEDRDYDSEVIGHTYKMYACGCEDATCDECATEYVSSEEFVINAPEGEISLNNESYCEDPDAPAGEMMPGSAYSNRAWFKFVATASNGKSQTVYANEESMGDICAPRSGQRESLLSKLVEKVQACVTEPFIFERGDTYNIEMFLCHTLLPSDGDVMLGDCEDTPLDSQVYTASTCAGDEVDVAVEAINLPILESGGAITVDDNVEVELIFSNYSGGITGPVEIAFTYGDFEVGGTAGIREITLDEGIPPGDEHFENFDLGTLPLGIYYAYAQISVGSAVIDTDPTNNSMEILFQVYQNDPSCTLVCDPDEYLTPDCRCVECIEDSHCGISQICDQGSNRCICDDSLCTSDPDDCGEKEMNSDCTACVCKDPCPLGQAQDTASCCCLDPNICELTPDDCDINNRELLDYVACECVQMGCIFDSDCEGREVCSLAAGLECVCPDCGPYMVSDENCTTCMCDEENYPCASNEIRLSDCSCLAVGCPNSCPSGQLQLADCSCYTPPQGCNITCPPGQILTADCTCYTPPSSNTCQNSCPSGQLQLANCSCYTPSYASDGTGGDTDTPNSYDSLGDEGVKLEIDSPEDEESIKKDKKELLRYKIKGSGDVDVDKVKWYVDGKEVGKGNFVSYTFEDKGDIEIEVKYKDESHDKIKVRVIEEQSQTGESDKEKEGIGIIWYFLIGAAVIVVVGIVIATFARGSQVE